MSNVHEEISRHSKKQHEIVKTFLELDQMREHYIDKAVSLAKEGKPFKVDDINRVTLRINDLAKNGIAPTRKLVTIEMVEEFANRVKE
jgi:hypothetical protein